MRRTLLAALLTALAVSPVQAAPGSVNVSDPANDWVPSEDILRITLSSGPQGRTRTVQVTFNLTAAPDAAATYRADLTSGKCDNTWSITASGLGTPNQAASVQRLPCAAAATPGATAPATVKVSGTRVEVTAPYALGLRKGLPLTNLTAFVGATFAGLYVGNNLGQDGFLLSGDLAWRPLHYKLR